MKRVGLFAKRNHPDAAELAARIAAWLQERGVEVCFEEALARDLGRDGHPEAEIPALVDMIIVLGGDGTLISVARAVGDRGTPILGVNLGSLGFLTEITRQELFQVLDQVLEDKYTVSERLMLEAVVNRNGSVANRYQLLNDVVINKGALARIIDMELYVNDSYLTTFKADGLIISSPTGSTAYNMAAGGPIIYPDADCFVITPICPHMLTNRPMIVPADSSMRIEVKFSDEDVVLTADGQVGMPLQGGDIVEVHRSSNRTRLILSPEKEYFEVLRTKLRWGER
ncbi:MAG: NAD(+)/NADH kinase [Desulfuromonadales bacterium]|nr:NAD(+)/NADH kinase [Desulfuromonadales bacterium]NIS42781.1 NAD(+)/NADH kinase [Desulfuromonadales bacterium]